MERVIFKAISPKYRYNTYFPTRIDSIILCALSTPRYPSKKRVFNRFIHYSSTVYFVRLFCAYVRLLFVSYSKLAPSHGVCDLFTRDYWLSAFCFLGLRYEGCQGDSRDLDVILTCANCRVVRLLILTFFRFRLFWSCLVNAISQLWRLGGYAPFAFYSCLLSLGVFYNFLFSSFVCVVSTLFSALRSTI